VALVHCDVQSLPNSLRGKLAPFNAPVTVLSVGDADQEAVKSVVSPYFPDCWYHPAPCGALCSGDSLDKALAQTAATQVKVLYPKS